jgi:class 3 adenylate cyclase
LQNALLEAYLGRRSAARVQAGALGRGAGETIRAALLYADLRGFRRCRKRPSLRS